MKRINYYLLFPLFLGCSLLMWACDKDGDINFFSIQQDVEFGQQVAAEIEKDPSIIVLNEQEYAEAYTYIRGITANVLNSNQVQYRDEFPWQVKIIHDDETLNAFCAPGGYIYVYTGLIKYLDTEDQLAGVMGHEIAHADKRHVTDQMTRDYGYQTLLQVLLGDNQGTLTEIAKGLVGLKHTRAAEREADDQSVIYLCATEYQANGAAGFFEKIIAEGGASGTPEFLSTHPNPDNRVQAINNLALERNCSITPSGNNYARFKQMIP